VIDALASSRLPACASAGAARHARLRRCRRLSRLTPPSPSTASPQSYLTEADFNTVFGMPFDEFDKLPSWKQKAMRQKANLY